MKNLKMFTLLFALFIGLSAFADTEKVSIKTSAQCEECKARIEEGLLKMNGVKKVMLNVETKTLEVKFDNSVVSLAEIKKEIAGLGYWADDVMPHKEAYDALPACCKPVKSCCASKTSCSKDGEKKECSKDAVKTEEGTSTPSKTCTGHSH
ncbi:MAG: heavy-metal-associated domain-containing protein [Bacteroidetes bacterium]|nr:heavy-metal-associated domain-containing protein [Bacteroidota bacterium]